MASKKPSRSKVRKSQKGSGKVYTMPTTSDGMNKMMKKLVK